MFPRTLPTLLFLLQYLSVVVLGSIAPPADKNATPPDCSCYQATGNSGALFTYHQFYDFRNLDAESVASNFSPPAPIAATQDRGIEPLTSSFFGKSLFGSYFIPANWIKNASEMAPTRMVNSQQNVYLGKDQSAFAIRCKTRN